MWFTAYSKSKTDEFLVGRGIFRFNDLCICCIRSPFYWYKFWFGGQGQSTAAWYRMLANIGIDHFGNFDSICTVVRNGFHNPTIAGQLFICTLIGGNILCRFNGLELDTTVNIDYKNIIEGKFKFDPTLTEYSIIIQEKCLSLVERTLPFPDKPGQVYVCVHIYVHG